MGPNGLAVCIHNNRPPASTIHHSQGAPGVPDDLDDMTRYSERRAAAQASAGPKGPTSHQLTDQAACSKAQLEGLCFT
ncbi:hypothetical protein PAMA_014313 [Pampus argenteus]